MSDTVKPPKFIRDAAARALKAREAYAGMKNKPLTTVGLARANQLKNGEPLSLKTLKRMSSFLSRHEKNYRPGERKSGRLTKGTIGVLAWGGPRAKSWVERQIQRLEA